MPEESNDPAGLLQLDWRKASRCQGNGDCVEVASASGRVAVRDSKHKDGPVLMYSSDVWQSFLGAAKRGALDLRLQP